MFHLIMAVLAVASSAAPGPAADARTERATTRFVTPIYGFTVDPEALLVTAGLCGDRCTAPPAFKADNPLYGRARVSGASVRSYDLGSRTFGAPRTSAGDATFELPAVESRRVPWFWVEASGGTSAPEDVQLPVPPLPAGHFLPTLTVRPISTFYSMCATVPATLVRDDGVLDAVARHLSVGGRKVTPRDLLDRKRWSAVAVWVATQPAFTGALIPAFNAGLSAPGAQVLPIGFAPPGQVPPAVSKRQSPLGFFVQPGDRSPVGIFAVLVPAKHAGPVTVTMRNPPGADSASWISQPLQLPAGLPDILFVPGQLSLPPRPDGLPNGPPEPAYECLPESP